MKVYTSAGVLKTSAAGTPHSSLTGLTSGDDHTQYLKEAVLTTKGDLYVATAASTVTRLAVSSDNLALVGSAAASEGVAWGLPQGANASLVVGTSTFDVRWTGAFGSSAPTTFAMTVDTLYAYPVFVPFTTTIDRICLEVTTGGGAGADVRCGVYANDSRTHPKPAALLYDGGEKDATSVAVHSTTISPVVTLTGPAIYWFAMLSGTSAPTVRALNASNIIPLLGWPSTGGASLYSGVTRAFAYAALPDPFGTPTLRVGSEPLVAVRFA